MELCPATPPSAVAWDGIDFVKKGLAEGGRNDIHLVSVAGREMVVKTGKQEEDVSIVGGVG